MTFLHLNLLHFGAKSFAYTENTTAKAEQQQEEKKQQSDKWIKWHKLNAAATSHDKHGRSSLLHSQHIPVWTMDRIKIYWAMQMRFSRSFVNKSWLSPTRKLYLWI